MVLKYVSRIKVSLTNNRDLSAGGADWHSVEEVLHHLAQSAGNAVVILEVEEDSGECRATTPQYVICGASESYDNYYYGPYPADDPNNANGGDLTAVQALTEAVEALCG